MELLLEQGGSKVKVIAEVVTAAGLGESVTGRL